MRTIRAALALGLVTLLSAAAAAQTMTDPNLTVQNHLLNPPGMFQQPTTMAFLGPDEFLILEKATGRVWRVLNRVIVPPFTPALDVNVHSDSERGLLGIAVDPGSPIRVFLYYTETAGNDTDDPGVTPLGNRVYRYDWNTDTHTLVNGQMILDLPVTTGPNHNGGVLVWDDAAEHLYVVIGDLNRNGQMQNNAGGAAADNSGGVLRVNSDGTPAAGNPFTPYCSVTTAQTCSSDLGCPGGETCRTNVARYFAYGIRNSFGMTLDPGTGALWTTENGPASFDEINRVDPGFNSGWNRIQGPDSRDPQGTGDLFHMPGAGITYSDPEFSWLSPVAPTAIAFPVGSSWGPAYADRAVVGDNNTGQIYAFPLNVSRTGFDLSGGLADLVADSATERNSVRIGQGFGVVTDIERGPELPSPHLYVVSLSAGTIYRISGPVLNADLSLTKTDGQATAIPGQSVTYTIVATNGGPNAATGSTVQDTVPAALTGATWTCVGAGGGTCAAAGTGDIDQTVNLPAGASVTFTLSGVVDPEATGMLSNSATVLPASGVTDPSLGNNSATDTDPLAPEADLSISKTDGLTTATPGQAISYTIVVGNSGPSAVTTPGATVTDTVPAALTGATWICVGAGGGTCTASGTGSINDTANLPVGASVTYTLNGTLSPSATGSLANTASVAAPGGVPDPIPGNNTAADTDTIVACGPERVLVPDGRLAAGIVASGASAWVAASVRIGNSYSVEFKNTTGSAASPGTLTVFSGDDACGDPSSLTTRDTAGIDPAGSPGAARQSFTATGTTTYFRARLENGSASPISYSVSWSDTTLFSPAWSDFGGFDTYYSFQNTTGATLNGTLVLRNASGTEVISTNLTIPAGQTASVNTAGLGIARNQAGTATFRHDDPPAAIVAEAAVANFAISPAYVQPVKFLAMREATH